MMINYSIALKNERNCSITFDTKTTVLILKSS